MVNQSNAVLQTRSTLFPEMWMHFVNVLKNDEKYICADGKHSKDMKEIVPCMASSSPYDHRPIPRIPTVWDGARRVLTDLADNRRGGGGGGGSLSEHTSTVTAKPRDLSTVSW